MKKMISWKNKTAKKKYLQALINNVNTGAVLYNKDHSHNVGDYISHSKFGLGFIQKIISRTKIEVFFESSEKVMMQNWQKA